MHVEFGLILCDLSRHILLPNSQKFENVIILSLFPVTVPSSDHRRCSALASSVSSLSDDLIGKQHHRDRLLKTGQPLTTYHKGPINVLSHVPPPTSRLSSTLVARHQFCATSSKAPLQHPLYLSYFGRIFLSPLTNHDFLLLQPKYSASFVSATLSSEYCVFVVVC